MSKKKLMWLVPIVAVLVLWIGLGVSRYVRVNNLAHDLQFGGKDEQSAAAAELIQRDKLFEVVQAMPGKDRAKAVQALKAVPDSGEHGEATVKQCLALLKDSDIKTRTTALLTEAQNDVRSLTFLRESDKSRHTADELKKSEALVKAYTATIADEAAFHTATIKVLGEIGKKHIDLLRLAMKDPDPNVSVGDQDALTAIGAPAVPGLIADARDAIDLRPFACAVLVRIKDPAVAPTIELLKDKDQDVRMAAADTLGKIGSKVATPALIESTKDTQAVRRVAISALCALCDPTSTDVLVEVLSHSTDDGEVRARSARALSVIGGSKALAALTGALGDLDLKVRTSVITGLQKMGPVAVQPVLTAMANGSADVRQSGARAIALIDSAQAAGALASLASNADPVVREAVAEGLGRQTNGKLDTLIALLGDRDGRVADAASQSLASLDAKAVPSLMAALSASANEVVRLKASEALSHIGKAAVPSLMAMLSKGGDATKWAVYTLGRSGDPEVKSALTRLEASGDQDLASIARDATHRL